MSVFSQYTGSISWNVNANGNWFTASNWTPKIPAGGIDKSVTIPAIFSAIRTITCDDIVAVKSLTFSDSIITIQSGKQFIFYSTDGSDCTITHGGTIAGQRALYGSGYIVLQRNLNVTNNSAQELIFGLISGNGNLTLSGNTSLGYYGPCSYIGTTTLNSGSLTIYNQDPFGDANNAVTLKASVFTAQSVTSPSTRVFTINGGVSIGINPGTTWTIQGTILALSGGSASNYVRSSGTGTLKIAGTWTSTIGLTQTTGTLSVTGTIASGTALAFNLGVSTLTGNGTINRTVAFSNTVAMVLQPGDSGVGTLTINGTLTMGTICSLIIKTSGSTTSSIAAGDLTLTSVLNLPDASLNVGFYNIITYTGTLTDSRLTLGVTNNTGKTINISVDKLNKIVQIKALAGNSSWNVNSNGNWNTSSNWTPATVPTGSRKASIGNTITLSRTITVDADVTIDSIEYLRTTAGAGAVLTIDASGGSKIIFASSTTGPCQLFNNSTVAGNNLIVSSPIQLNNNLEVQLYSALVLTTTISGLISGTGTIEKTGNISLNTSLTLSNTSNSFVGNTIITSGTIVNTTGSDGVFGNSTNGIVLNGGTLSITTTGYTSSRNYQLSNGGGTITPSVNIAISGIISGTGNLTVNGSGVLTLSNANTFIGTLSNTVGSLSVSNDNNFGDVSNIVNFIGLTITDNVTSPITRNFTVVASAVITVNTSKTFTMNGGISANNAWSKTGAGTFVFAGVNTSTGAITLNGGLTQITGSFTGASGQAMTINTGANLEGTGSIKTIAYSVTGASFVAPGLSGVVGILTCTGFTMASTNNTDNKLRIYTSGSSVSKLVVNGNVTLKGQLELTSSSLNTGTYDIITFTGTLTNTSFTLGTNNTGKSISISTATANKVQIIVT